METFSCPLYSLGVRFGFGVGLAFSLFLTIQAKNASQAGEKFMKTVDGKETAPVPVAPPSVPSSETNSNNDPSLGTGAPQGLLTWLCIDTGSWLAQAHVVWGVSSAFCIYEQFCLKFILSLN